MLPAEHKGHVETRKWYKVRWKDNPYPELPAWNGIAGKTDLMMDEDFERYKGFVEILQIVRTDTCVTSMALGFGRLTEDKIDEWLARNKK